MGVPVVATDIRGCRQAVDDGVTGRLVPVRDAGALAAAIEDLTLAPDVRARMGGAARTKAAQEFDQRRVIAITLSVYEELLTQRAKPDSTSWTRKWSSRRSLPRPERQVAR